MSLTILHPVQAKLDSFVGQIWPVGHQLITTALNRVHKVASLPVSFYQHIGYSSTLGLTDSQI